MRTTEGLIVLPPTLWWLKGILTGKTVLEQHLERRKARLADPAGTGTPVLRSRAKEKGWPGGHPYLHNRNEISN